MTTSLVWAILILIIGLLLLVAEVFVTSGGILAILAGATLIGSIALAFSEGRMTGTIFLIVVLVSLPAAFAIGMHYWPKTAFGRWVSLAGPKLEDIAPTNDTVLELHALLGQVGRTITPLRPAGITDFAGRRVDTI